MAIEIRKVVKEGYEGFYADAQSKLANLDNEVEAKVAEYRAQIAEKFKDDKVRLENILEMCQEEKEVEVEEVVEEETETTEETEVPNEEVAGE